eukprot:7388484-Prymnesium_polylepis.5
MLLMQKGQAADTNHSSTIDWFTAKTFRIVIIKVVIVQGAHLAKRALVIRCAQRASTRATNADACVALRCAFVSSRRMRGEAPPSRLHLKSLNRGIERTKEPIQRAAGLTSMSRGICVRPVVSLGADVAICRAAHRVLADRTTQAVGLASVWLVLPACARDALSLSLGGLYMTNTAPLRLIRSSGRCTRSLWAGFARGGSGPANVGVVSAWRANPRCSVCAALWAPVTRAAWTGAFTASLAQGVAETTRTARVGRGGTHRARMTE